MIFVEQPIDAGVGMLSTASQIPMRFLKHPKLAAPSVSFATESLPLDVILDFISVDYSLSWGIDETGTVVVNHVPEEA